MLCSTVPGSDPLVCVTQERRKHNGISWHQQQSVSLNDKQLGWNKAMEGTQSLWEEKKITTHLPILTAQGEQAALQNKAASARFEILGYKAVEKHSLLLCKTPTYMCTQKFGPHPNSAVKRRRFWLFFSDRAHKILPFFLDLADAAIDVREAPWIRIFLL